MIYKVNVGCHDVNQSNAVAMVTFGSVCTIRYMVLVGCCIRAVKLKAIDLNLMRPNSQSEMTVFRGFFKLSYYSK